MRYNQLNQYDQELLNTDLGDFDKEASAMVKMASEGYEMGFEKLAVEIADALEVQAIEEDMAKTASYEDDTLDDESEKIAAEMGAFIERGVFEGLQKLGQERYGNPDIYVQALAIEKLAAAEGEKASKSMKDRLKGAWDTTTEYAGKAKNKVVAGGKIIKDYHTAANEDLKAAWKGSKLVADPVGAKIDKGLSKLERLTHGSKGVARYLPHAAGVAALGTYGYKKLKGKKKDEGSPEG